MIFLLLLFKNWFAFYQAAKNCCPKNMQDKKLENFLCEMLDIKDGILLYYWIFFFTVTENSLIAVIGQKLLTFLLPCLVDQQSLFSHLHLS